MAENLLDPAPDNAARPEDIPEKFWDAEKQALRVDALLKSYRELEKRLSQRFAPPAEDAPEEERARFRRALGVPDSPEDYAIEPKHAMCGPDPEVNQRLHEAGFTCAQVQLVYDLAAERLLPLIAEAAADYEAQKQRARLEQEFGGAEGFQRIAPQIAAWGRANLAKPVYEALSTTAEGVLALHRMMGKAEPNLASRAEAPEAIDEQALRRMMRDPRYWRAREPEYVKRVTDGFRRLFGQNEG
ncbi:capsid assembly protein [Pseudoroseomonas cervicalis]|uniref:capsid assembly protein n=1 Tax=Teichococcus cervicalis TaxID=204525 RepID=UPI00278B2E05|nr:hypothetical protein [Pseudoroseomonas cervicalis]MDQ1080424.1 hypothetical protein [Pseudoroseomonas cervicalis]